MALLVLWQSCLEQLESEVPTAQFNTWLRPLKAQADADKLLLMAPNRFFVDWVRGKFLNRIEEIVTQANGGKSVVVEVEVLASKPVYQNTVSKVAHVPNKPAVPVSKEQARSNANLVAAVAKKQAKQTPTGLQHDSMLNPKFTFDSFVEGKSNQFALATARQVAENSGSAYNPLFIYGGVGLGKTHLMHAVGNELLRKNPSAKVLFVSSQRFVDDMVKGLKLNAINEFKRYYRGLDALLIDDIQFFAGKDRSQEEFFHTFNILLENSKQVILTCDRYPKEIDHLEERLKSRFGWGMTALVEPPELETRVAILLKKAEEYGFELSSESAFFIAQKIRSNVRELEGTLRRVIATAQFTGNKISIALIKESLKDLIALQDRLISIDNIQRTVAEYYNLKLTDLLSSSRRRSLARPRQLAMALSKELTDHSLPEIGHAFGKRDHSTVLYACRRIKELQVSQLDIAEDYKILIRTLTT